MLMEPPGSALPEGAEAYPFNTWNSSIVAGYSTLGGGRFEVDAQVPSVQQRLVLLPAFGV
jgi:hypothetical protein